MLNNKQDLIPISKNSSDLIALIIENNLGKMIDILNLEPTIKQHLLKNQKFIKTLSEEFDSSVVTQVQSFLANNIEYSIEIADDLSDWFNNAFLETNVNVLSIAWDSDGWGPGGNGVISFLLCFGLVNMNSSDYESDHVEIFDKDTFFPWGIEELYNDTITLDSDIYNDDELIKLAIDMGISMDSSLIINGNPIQLPKW